MLTNKIIRIKRGSRTKLAKLFGLDENYVSSMLNFTYNTPRARRVRHVALHDFGGRLYVVVDYLAAENKGELIKDNRVVSAIIP